MNWITRLNTLFAPRELSRPRATAAVIVAVLADLLQVILLPVAWSFAQEAVDVVAMILTMALLGFHLLLLPTFAVEFIPVVDMLPTWTGCVVAVIALRKREQQNDSAKPLPIVEVPPPEQSARPTGGGSPRQGDVNTGNDMGASPSP
jgi:hypothetical protein